MCWVSAAIIRENKMSYQPSNILKAWTLLVQDTDPTAATAAEQIRELAAYELLHAWLEGWIAPVGQAKPVELESKPVELESKPVELEWKPVEFKPAPSNRLPLGKREPGLAYKSVPAKINGLMARDLLQKMAVSQNVSLTKFLTQFGFRNGLGSLKSAVESASITTAWAEWLVELLGDQIRVLD